MTPRTAALLAILAAAVLGADEYALPEEKGAVVLRLARGGLVGGSEPLVEILRDGTVRVEGGKTSGRMPRKELQALLRFVIEEKQLFDYDERAVARTLARRRPGPMCGTGATRTEVFVRLRGRKTAKRQLLLRSTARDHPDIAPLQRLLAIADRLGLEGRLARAGGRKRVSRWLERANARLAGRHPDEAPFELTSFEGIREIPRGEGIPPPGADPALKDLHGRCAHFVRRSGTPQRIVSASVRIDSKQPVVAVSVQG